MSIKIRYLPLLFVGAMTAAHALAGMPQNALIQQAMQNMQLDKLAGWSYDRTTVLNGTTYVEHFDPDAAANKHWTLISINGQVPTNTQAVAYASGKNPVTGDDLEKSDDGSLVGISDDVPGDLKNKQSLGCLPADDGLTVIKETDQQIAYGFKPDCRGLLAKIKQKAMASKSLSNDPDKAEKAEKSAELSLQMLEHTSGILVISKKGPYVSSIQLVNKLPFTEMHVVKISKLNIEDQFGIRAGGKSVLVSDSGAMNGTAFFFKTIKQDSEVTFSKFSKALDPVKTRS